MSVYKLFNFISNAKLLGNTYLWGITIQARARHRWWEQLRQRELRC